jgi:hypothetical protein
MGWVLMNERELHRVGVLAEIRAGNRTLASGAAVLGLTRRHMGRLIERYGRFGAAGLVMVIGTGHRTGAVPSPNASLAAT